MARRPARRDEDDASDTIVSDEPITGLEIFDDEAFGSIVWYFYRIPDENERESMRHGYCHKAYGVLDPESIRVELGGGLYRVMGREGRTLVKTVRVRIAGPPKEYPNANPPPAAPAAGDRILERLDAMERRIQAPPVAPAPSAIELVQTLGTLMQTFRQVEPSPSSLVPTMLNMFEKGMAISKGGGDGMDVPALVREAVNGLVALSGRPGGEARVPPAGHPPSSAQVVAAAPPDGDATDDLVRLLVRAWANGRTADEAADAAEAVLTEMDVFKLKAAPDEQVMAIVRARCGRTGADLVAIETYVTAFLASLRQPSDTEENIPGA